MKTKNVNQLTFTCERARCCPSDQEAKGEYSLKTSAKRGRKDQREGIAKDSDSPFPYADSAASLSCGVREEADGKIEREIERDVE